MRLNFDYKMALVSAINVIANSALITAIHNKVYQHTLWETFIWAMVVVLFQMLYWLFRTYQGKVLLKPAIGGSIYFTAANCFVLQVRAWLITENSDWGLTTVVNIGVFVVLMLITEFITHKVTKNA